MVCESAIDLYCCRGYGAHEHSCEAEVQYSTNVYCTLYRDGNHAPCALWYSQASSVFRLKPVCTSVFCH